MFLPMPSSPPSGMMRSLFSVVAMRYAGLLLTGPFGSMTALGHDNDESRSMSGRSGCERRPGVCTCFVGLHYLVEPAGASFLVRPTTAILVRPDQPVSRDIPMAASLHSWQRSRSADGVVSIADVPGPHVNPQKEVRSPAATCRRSRPGILISTLLVSAAVPPGSALLGSPAPLARSNPKVATRPTAAHARDQDLRACLNLSLRTSGSRDFTCHLPSCRVSPVPPGGALPPRSPCSPVSTRRARRPLPEDHSV